MSVRGIRGATTAEANSRQAILDTTKELLQRIVSENALQLDDLASVLITTTADLDATFPALAARQTRLGHGAADGRARSRCPGRFATLYSGALAGQFRAHAKRNAARLLTWCCEPAGRRFQASGVGHMASWRFGLLAARTGTS